MADYLVTDTELASVANAIRTKGNTTASLSFPTEFVSAINAIPTGGGSASSPLVQGEFKTNDSAGVQSITIPYTGNGYPIAAMVFIKGGAYNSASTPWYTSAQRYAVGQWTMHKANQNTTPTFTTSGAVNQGVTTWVFKNTSSTSYSRSSAMNTNVFSSNNASNAGATCVRFKSKTQLSVYINTSSYGLLPSQDYQYIIVYSE